MQTKNMVLLFLRIGIGKPILNLRKGGRRVRGVFGANSSWFGTPIMNRLDDGIKDECTHQTGRNCAISKSVNPDLLESVSLLVNRNSVSVPNSFSDLPLFFSVVFLPQFGEC